MSDTDITLRPFLFKGEATVRTLERAGCPWFVAKDICGALGLANHRQAVERLEEVEKGVITVDTLGGPQDMVVVSESGLFALAFTSRKPEAVTFRLWVTGEVLPAIRRTGSYSMGVPADDEVEVNTPDDLKLRKVNTAIRAFGPRSGAELWVMLGCEITPSMRQALAQGDLLEDLLRAKPLPAPLPPGTVTLTVTPNPAGMNGGAH